MKLEERLMSNLKWSRLIVALDSQNKNKIRRIITELSPYVKKFKLGLIGFVKFGPGLLKMLTRKDLDVFLDLKFYDIPNTMKQASFAAIDAGIWAFTVHLKAGEDALRQLRSGISLYCRKKRKKKPLIFGVTELTSKSCSQSVVLKLAHIASRVKLNGVVCSAQEAPAIKKKFKHLKIITPGIRKDRSTKDDQKRTATAKEALKVADYIVVGRPILKAKNYLQAAKDLLSR